MGKENFAGLKRLDRWMIKPSNTPLPQITGDIVSIQIGDFPNVAFSGAIDLNTIIDNAISRSSKNSMESIELSDYANEAIAGAIAELESGSCKTFSSIDELLEDLERD